MKLQYWDIFEQQLPRLWRGSNTVDGIGLIKIPHTPRIVRVKGYKHTEDRLRYIYQVAADYPEHTFMVFSIDMYAFRELYFPPNVLPVLQVNSRKTYSDNIDNYIDLCQELDIEMPTLSVFCNHAIDASKYIKWLILAGDNADVLSRTITLNKKRMLQMYVEQYKYSYNVPNELNIRQIPELSPGQVFPAVLQRTYNAAV